MVLLKDSYSPLLENRPREFDPDRTYIPVSLWFGSGSKCNNLLVKLFFFNFGIQIHKMANFLRVSIVEPWATQAPLNKERLLFIYFISKHIEMHLFSFTNQRSRFESVKSIRIRHLRRIFLNAFFCLFSGQTWLLWWTKGTWQPCPTLLTLHCFVLFQARPGCYGGQKGPGNPVRHF